MLLGTDLKEIKYVAIEVVKSGVARAADVECGLFMGICRKKNNQDVYQNFLSLMITESSVRLYNLNTYNIVTVDTVDKSSRYMTVFLNEDDDQKAAVKLLDEITSVLKTEDKLYENDPNGELINVENYEEYPATVLNSNNLTGDITSSGKETTTRSGSTYSSKDYTHKSVPTKPVLTVIKRKGRLPQARSLEAMKNKVMQLADGTFKLKTLPIPTCDIKVEKEAGTEDKKK